MDLQEKKLSSEEIYNGKIIRVERETVLTPDGQQAFREIVRHQGAVCVLVVDDQNRMLLVRQWREPLRQVTAEVPAGKIERGEDPQMTVVRELNEEVRLQAQEIALVNTYYTSPGFADEKMYFYVAHQLSPVAQARPQDPGEFLRLQWVTLPEAEQLIAQGEVCDAKTINAIWYWKLQRHEENK